MVEVTLSQIWYNIFLLLDSAFLIQVISKLLLHIYKLYGSVEYHFWNVIILKVIKLKILDSQNLKILYNI
jgi:hypothetical protein